MKKTSIVRAIQVTLAVFLLTALHPFSAPAQWMSGGMDPGMGMGRMCRMMDVTSHPVDPASLPAPDSSGARILKKKCTQCHGLVSPRRHAVEDWPYILDRMDRRMHMMSQRRMGMMRNNIEPLTAEERRVLLDYLQANAFRALPAETPSQSKNPGAQAFFRTCSQCHALPDPATYSAAQWPSVLKRMDAMMGDMGFGGLTNEQKDSILGYLQENARGE